MGAYPAPQYGALRTSVAQDLRDPNKKTFTDEHLKSLVNEGIAELDRLRPLEQVVTLPWVYPTGSVSLDNQIVIVLEAQHGDDTAPWLIVPKSTGDLGGIASDGWDQWGDELLLPHGIYTTELTTFRALVYGGRGKLIDDDEVAPFSDSTDEEVVRSYARWTALEMLLHDRALYQQWQMQANASDVSPTQLLQIASTYRQAWADLRKRAVRLRRAA